MKPAVSTQSRVKTHRRKKKLGRSIFVFISTVVVLVLFGFYGTESGHQLRRMIAGSILSSQHPQFALFLLGQAELGQLKDIIAHPSAAQSELVGSSIPAIAPVGPLVETQTVENVNFTAKIMIVSDPTTVHLVETKYKNKGEPLSELIKDHNAVGGINAGGFQDDNGIGSGGQPIGIAIGNGQILSSPAGNLTQQMLIGGFTSSGTFVTGSYSIKELQAMKVTEAVSFGPQLIVDGHNVVSSSINAAYGWAPRTAIGQTADGKVVMIITDGRYYQNKLHRGASVADLVTLFQSYHAVSAI
ncbi:MAG: exopolysaccharide biosynthesis protein, partial [Bacilli bacterium]|nr:exopolysaccharide biosynthesis protein [Bacilli bacterium]